MRYLVLFFLCVATVIAYIQRSAMNGATAVIEVDLHINSRDLGWIMGGWYLAYSLFQLPGGWVADRLGSKRALVLFAASWSALTGLAGVAGMAAGWTGLLLTWSLMGACQAAIFPSCTKAIGAAFPRNRQAFASGMLACCMSIGAGLSPLMTGHLLAKLPWHQIFALYAAPGLLWALLFALLVPRLQDTRPRPPTAEANEAIEANAQPPEAARDAPPWLRLLSDGQMILLCFQQFLRAGAMVFFFTWFARYLENARHLSPLDAGTLASWPPFAGALGGLCGGLISEWILRVTGNPRIARQGMTFAFLLGCTGAAGTAYFIDEPRLAVLLISFGAFCGVASGVSAYALAIAYGGKRVATVFATMNMSGNLGATMFPIAVGVITAEGNWNRALLLFVAMFGLSAVCWLFLNPTGTLFDEETHDAS